MARRTYATFVAAGHDDFLTSRLDEFGWAPAASDTEWNLHWSYPVQPLRYFRMLDDTRRINHFPGIGPMVFKDEMHEHLARAGCTFVPRTFSMPDDLVAWRGAVAADPDAIWIRKRKWSGNGDGVALVTELGEMPTSEDWLVQEYVADPLLLPGNPHRHTIRAFVLVTSLDPLVAYLHTAAIATHASRPYSRSPESLADPVAHITSAPVQYTNTDVDDPVRSIDHVEYRRRLEDGGIDADRLWRDVGRVATESVRALHQPVLQLSSMITDRIDCCFELLGYDLVVDEQLSVWLLEINKGPGIGSTTRGATSAAAQARVKNAVVDDTLAMIGAPDPAWPVGVDPERFDAELERRGGFERIVGPA